MAEWSWKNVNAMNVKENATDHPPLYSVQWEGRDAEEAAAAEEEVDCSSLVCNISRRFFLFSKILPNTAQLLCCKISKKNQIKSICLRFRRTINMFEIKLKWKPTIFCMWWRCFLFHFITARLLLTHTFASCVGISKYYIRHGT